MESLYNFKSNFKVKSENKKVETYMKKIKYTYSTICTILSKLNLP